MSQAGSITGFGSVRIENALVPKEGPKIVPVTLDFSASDLFNIDFALTVAQKKIEIIQGVYIDNANNDFPFTLAAEATKQEITVPARSQGYYPLLAGQQPKFTGVSNGSSGQTYIAFLNVPVPAIQWNSGIGSIGAVNQGAPGALPWPVTIQNAAGNINSTNPLIIASADPVITATVTIPNATNVSGNIAIPEGYCLSNILPPAVWTAANIWALGSHDGVTFFNIKDANGNNIVIPFDNVFAVTIPPALLMGWPFLRFQSVNTATPTTPVNQGADRIIGYSLARVS